MTSQCITCPFLHSSSPLHITGTPAHSTPWAAPITVPSSLCLTPEQRVMANSKKLAQHHPKNSHQLQPQVPLPREEVVSENVGWDSRIRCFNLDLLKIKLFLTRLQPQGQDSATKAASHGDKAVALTDTHTPNTWKFATQPFPYH